MKRITKPGATSRLQLWLQPPKLFLVLLFLCLQSCFTEGYAQSKTYMYSYDQAGNRISRIIDLTKTAAIATDSTGQKEQAEVVEDYLDEQKIRIYPNPTDGILTVELPSTLEQTVRYRLYNMNGQLLLDTRSQDTMTEFDISGYPSGFYLLQIMAGHQSVTWKIIKN